MDRTIARHTPHFSCYTHEQGLGGVSNYISVDLSFCTDNKTKEFIKGVFSNRKKYEDKKY